MLCIALPSAIISFSGIVVGLVRAFVWGIIFSPQAWPSNIVHVLRGILIGMLLILEGQGYVLSLLAAYVPSATFLFSKNSAVVSLGKRIDLNKRDSAYLFGSTIGRGSHL